MFPVHSRIDLDSMEGLGFWAKKISITLVDRCEENGRQNIEDTGVRLHSIFTVHDFM